MAILLSPGVRVCTSANVPISGGKVRVYNQNTTTLSTLYSDAALSVPLSNPVICNSAGYPTSDGVNTCGIFCAAATYDVAFLTAGSVVVASFDDVPSTGSDSSTFVKDFGAGGRFQIRGSADTIYLEAGDPTGDDIGGNMRLGGWNSTQATTMVLDSAAVNVGTSDGALKENSKKLPSIIYTDVTSFSGTTGCVIALPESPADVREYEIDIWDLVSGGVNVDVTAQLSYDNGATYKSAAGDYIWYIGIFQHNAGTPQWTYTGSASDTKMVIIYTLLAVNNRPGRAKINILTPDSGNNSTYVRTECDTPDSGTSTYPGWRWSRAEGKTGYGRATHIKILQGANTLTFKYRLKIIRGSGEA